MGQAITASAADDGWPATSRTIAVLATAAKPASVINSRRFMRSAYHFCLHAAMWHAALQCVDESEVGCGQGPANGRAANLGHVTFARSVPLANGDGWPASATKDA